MVSPFFLAFAPAVDCRNMDDAVHIIIELDDNFPRHVFSFRVGPGPRTEKLPTKLFIEAMVIIALENFDFNGILIRVYRVKSIGSASRNGAVSFDQAFIKAGDQFTVF